MLTTVDTFAIVALAEILFTLAAAVGLAALLGRGGEKRSRGAQWRDDGRRTVRCTTRFEVLTELSVGDDAAVNASLCREKCHRP